MQETLSQLTELNNEQIAESSRTARKLADGEWAEEKSAESSA